MDLEDKKLIPENRYVMNDGTLIFERGKEFEWEYLILKDYNDIKKEFPEFNPENKNGEFVICEKGIS